MSFFGGGWGGGERRVPNLSAAISSRKFVVLKRVPLLASLVPTSFCAKFPSGPVYLLYIYVGFQKPQYKTDQKIQNNGRRGFSQNNLKRPLEYQSSRQLQKLNTLAPSRGLQPIKKRSSKVKDVTFRENHYNHECCTALVTLFVVLHFIIKMISCYRILFLSFGLISSHLTQARTAKSLKTSDCRS